MITADTLIGDMLDMNPDFEDILLGQGLHCLGCPASRGETIAEACELHGINSAELLEQLNAR